jgi:hypothetical protein
LVLASALLAGRQSPAVVQTGPDTYMLARSSAAGAFANTSKMKSEVIQDANRFAESKGKIAVRISSEESRPPVGGFPSYEYHFRLQDRP